MSSTAAATTDTSGNVITSADRSTNHSASTASKLAVDVKGAVKGVAGSMEAAVGTAIRNETMADKGFEKMSEGKNRPLSPQWQLVLVLFQCAILTFLCCGEDHRLGAKRGVPSVGAGMRNTVTDTEQK